MLGLEGFLTMGQLLTCCMILGSNVTVLCLFFHLSQITEIVWVTLCIRSASLKSGLVKAYRNECHRKTNQSKPEPQRLKSEHFYRHSWISSESIVHLFKLLAKLSSEWAVKCSFPKLNSDQMFSWTCLLCNKYYPPKIMELPVSFQAAC